MTNIQESINDPKNCIKCNIEGTLNVIDACLKNNSKLVFASSSAVYPLQ
jgi:nucleoside-diphosphate-sugar epimerase